MTLSLGKVSEAVTLLVAAAAPALTAIRVGQNMHVTGFLWRNDLVVTTDQALPAAAGYTIVLASGALISARPGPRDPVNNLASLLLDSSVPLNAPEPARSATIGSLVMVMAADFDGSPTARLTMIHGFPRTHGGGGTGTAIALDLSGKRVSHGGMVLDAEGRLLGLASVSPGGDAIVVPHGTIARFVEAATSGQQNGTAASPAQTMTLPTVAPIPQVAMPSQAMAQPAMTQPATPAPVAEQPVQRTRPVPVANGGSNRGWLGVSLQPITVPENLAHRAGQRTARQVVGVTRGGPADLAGLRSGDVLLSLDGASTSGNHALRAFLAPERIGHQVEVRLMREGLIHSTILTVSAQPAS